MPMGPLGPGAMGAGIIVGSRQDMAGPTQIVHNKKGETTILDFGPQWPNASRALGFWRPGARCH